MKTFVNAFAMVMVAAAIPGVLPSTAWAQWPRYPTAGVPKTPAGTPDLAAPAPKTADGKPDLSGIWENFRGDGGPLGSFSGAGASTGLGPPGPVVSQFWNIATGLKEPLPFQPWAAELRKQRVSQNNKDNPDAHCLPLGLMQLHTHPEPRKIIQTPGVIVILYEANGGIRQIFTDGRPSPRNNPQPWWYGYSTGKWDGDTLVVETTGFRNDGWLDVEGSPLTEAGKMIERFRRVNYGNLEIEITVDDPKAYTKPWTVKVTQRIMLDTDLIEFVCQENEKDTPHLVAK